MVIKGIWDKLPYMVPERKVLVLDNNKEELTKN